ncbi:MAG: phosphatidate cytidylyltransferase [Bdellovibrionales bacterium]
MTFDIANLRLRLISSLVLAPLVLLAVYFGGVLYVLVVVAAVALATQEWLNLTRADFKLRLLGIPYVCGFGLALLYIRDIPVDGRTYIYYLLAVVWGTDIGAYVAGRLIGGPKLAPRVSPNKTWAGLFGGIVLACMFGYAMVAAIIGVLPPPGMAVVLSASLAILSQIGDLFESWVKRRAGVKESGNLIPGHGGILDRIDGLIFAVSSFALLCWAVGAGRFGAP